MKTWRIALASATFVLGAGCADVPPADPVTERSLTIIGGRPAVSPEPLGAVAVLDSDGTQYCTGALVSATCVVTAAHCVVLQDEATGDIVAELGPANMRVVAGSLSAANVPSEQVFRVRKVVRHQGFQAPRGASAANLDRANDIALLLLEAPVRTMTPVPLVSPEKLDVLVREGSPVTIAGYGARDAYGRASGTLYFGETPFRRRNATEFSAGTYGSPDGCVGDSGGPASISVGGEPHLLGIGIRALRSPGGPECGEGGIYTLIPAYQSWLEQNAGGEFGPVGDDMRSGCSFGRLRRGSGNPSNALLDVLIASVFAALRRRRRERNLSMTMRPNTSPGPARGGPRECGTVR